MNKYCGSCKENLLISEFNKNPSKKDGLQTNCKSCQNKRQREWYENNKEKHKRNIKEYKKIVRNEIHSKIISYLSKHPCVMCNESDIVVLEFDHLKDKKFEIAKMISNCTNWDSILLEIEKCQILCANCHRRKTSKQLNYYR
jgi:exopolysaccharide biosynthesis predicted pyruvyltransferase EpsI